MPFIYLWKNLWALQIELVRVVAPKKSYLQCLLKYYFLTITRNRWNFSGTPHLGMLHLCHRSPIVNFQIFFYFNSFFFKTCGKFTVLCNIPGRNGLFWKSKTLSVDSHGPTATSYAVSRIKINAEYLVVKWAFKIGNELIGMYISCKSGSKMEGSFIVPAFSSSLSCIFLFHLFTFPPCRWLDYNYLSETSKWKMLEMFFATLCFLSKKQKRKTSLHFFNGENLVQKNYFSPLGKKWSKKQLPIFHRHDWNFFEPTFFISNYKWAFNKIGARQTNEYGQNKGKLT